VNSKDPRPHLDSAAINSKLPSSVRSAVALSIQKTVESTNDAVVSVLSNSSGALFAVSTADEQTAGRGRLDRTWSSPFGAGVAMSLAFSADSLPHALTLIPLHFGVIVADVLADLGADVQLKWPNDIVIFEGDGTMGKIGGILCQKIGPTVVVGIGLNVSLTHEELPTPQATSLGIAGFRVSREEFIAGVISRGYELLVDSNHNTSWLADYERLCSTLNRNVEVQQADGITFSACATGVDSAGGLIVERDGQSLVVTVGDIIHLR